MYKRKQIFKDRGNESAFLWGPRQTGKTTLLKKLFPRSKYYDLLLSKEYARLAKRPSLLSEELSVIPSKSIPVIIDEIQKLPFLLDEVQWLITNKNISFILCCSSARKLKRVGTNLLGGRALRYEMHPLVSAEIPDFNLINALNNGLIPRHYNSKNPRRLLSSYIGDYLKEEIAAEALVRRVPVFSRFLESAAFSNGEIINMNNIASDCDVSAPTVKEYFSILEDTNIGHLLPSFQKKRKRRVITAPKFYYFDVGIANFLLKRGRIEYRGESFGKAFEHLIYQEILAHRSYSGLDYDFSFWRTASQFEVDFILGDHETAVEVKGVDMADNRHIKGLKAFNEEYKVKELILVTLDKNPRKMGNVLVLPWKVFLQKLWAGEIIGK